MASSQMTSQLGSMALLMAVVQGVCIVDLGRGPSHQRLTALMVCKTKYIDLTDENNIMYTRIAFYSVQVVLLACSYMVYRHIEGVKDETEISITPARSIGQTDEQPKQATSVRAYDYGELKKQLQQIFIGAAIITAMHFQWGYVQPMLLQSILPLKNILWSPVFRVHLLRQVPTESNGLMRPWVADNPFASLTGAGAEPQSTEEKEVAAPAPAEKETKKVK
jgi:hypothetical protein